MSEIKRIRIIEDAVRNAQRQAQDRRTVMYVHFDALRVWVREIGGSGGGWKHVAAVVGHDGNTGYASTPGQCMDCHADCEDPAASGRGCS